MIQTETNADYYRKRRTMEAHQRFISSLRESGGTSGLRLNTIRLERKPTNANPLTDALTPKNQPITIFEESPK